MRQTSNAKDEGETQGDEVQLGDFRDTILKTRSQDVSIAMVSINRTTQQFREATAHKNHDPYEHDDDSATEQHSLNHLYVSGTLHTTEQHVQDHDDTNCNHHECLHGRIVNVQQNSNQRTGSSHLCNEVEEGDEESRQGRNKANRLLTQAEAQYVGHGELTGVTQRFSDQQQCYEPSHEEAD